VGQLVELVDVSASENDVVRRERGDELLDRLDDALSPALLPESLEPAVADVVLVRLLRGATRRRPGVSV